MKPFRDDTEIAGALSAMRPAPRAKFAAELDARAAAGFPREHRAGTWEVGLPDRLRSTPPRRLLAPAGALAVAAVVVATAVVVSSESGSPTSTTPHPASTVPDAERPRLSQAPEAAASQPPRPTTRGGGESASGATATEYSAAPQLDTAPRPDTGPYASGAGRREVERSADMVLGTDPSEVRSAAAKVFEAVHSADGIVLRSAIRDGAAGEAGAEFDLLIPSGKLGDALAAFSAIAEVRSRRESTQDITAPTIGVGERLQDSRAKIESLLGELADADTESERAAVEAELRAERARAAALKSRLSTLKRRANFSRVSLRIETGAASTSGEGGAWGVGDGLDDAGRILAVAAGVTIVGLAILAPFAAILLLGWLTRRAWLQHSRARALGRA